MNKKKIREILAGVGISEVVSTRYLAAALKLSPRTIASARKKGELRQIDRGTYDLDSIVEWLFARPRYITRVCEKN